MLRESQARAPQASAPYLRVTWRQCSQVQYTQLRGARWLCLMARMPFEILAPKMTLLPRLQTHFAPLTYVFFSQHIGFLTLTLSCAPCV